MRAGSYDVNDRSKPKTWEEIPFGALDLPPDVEPPKLTPTPVEPAAPAPATPARSLSAPPRRDERIGAPEAPDATRRAPEPPDDEGRGGRRRRRGRRGGGRDVDGERGVEGERYEGREAGVAPDADEGSAAASVHPGQQGFEFEPHGADADERDAGRPDEHAGDDGAPDEGGPPAHGGPEGGEWRDGRRRRRRGRRGRGGQGFEGRARTNEQGQPFSGEGADALQAPRAPGHGAHPSAHADGRDAGPAGGFHGQHGQRPREERAPAQQLTGMLVLEKSGHGVLRRIEAQYLPSKEDIWVPPHLVQRFKLREGSLVTGNCGRGQQHKYALLSVEQVDGKDPRQMLEVPQFKKLTSIDPDFHYAVGDIQGDVSMRVLDVICPVGRGSRGLIVAPPRSGKTILMRKFANAITEGYPDVHLMVLLVDERPEEATEWQRSTKGQVFVSTNDEDTKNHVEIAEVVFKRCQRLVELGQDVVLLLDSITRLARAYNNHAGNSGKTMSGGLDSRAMERPRAFFGMARNTETAGSLTILGTTLVDTGSRLDQMVFEEFKGTGNMEIVLSRKLADRRIFPAIDIERSGTRKEEKLHSSTRLRRVQVLRRVLLKMNFAEAMELLVHKLENVDKLDDFLKRFDVDPDA
ncbi:MAG: transcription termination factor Rho [Planctomycetes bacterium]|nr:transcription termination factor Rho [Planctomycetota bacterium]